MVWVVPTRGLNQPWSMAFLPDGGILVTERPGCLRIVRNGALDPRHVAGLPPIQAAGLAGLMDIALHPQFAQNQLVYFTSHKPAATTIVPALNPTGPCTPVQQDGRGATAAAPGGRGANAPDAAAPAARGANAPAAAPSRGSRRRRRARDDHAGARSMGRHGASRRKGRLLGNSLRQRLADRVWQGRHALYDRRRG